MKTVLLVATKLTETQRRAIMIELTELSVLEHVTSNRDTITIKFDSQMLQNPGYLATYRYLKLLFNRFSCTDWLELQINSGSKAMIAGHSYPEPITVASSMGQQQSPPPHHQRQNNRDSTVESCGG